MDIYFTDITEDEIYLLYGFLGGYKQSGRPMDADKLLAKKLFDQLTPKAKLLLAEEYEEFCTKLDTLGKELTGMEVVLQKNFTHSPPLSN